MEHQTLTHLIWRDGLRYFVRENNTPESGPVLVMLHGFSGSSESFSHLVPELQKQFRVIRIDLAGHGLTRCHHPDPAGRFTTAHQLADLCFILHLLNISDWQLYGYSMGARLALQFAYYDESPISPPSRIILESGTPGISDKQEKADRKKNDDELAKQIETAFDQFLQSWDEKDVFTTPNPPAPELQQMQLQIRRKQNPSLLAASLRAFGTGSMPDLTKKIPELPIPAVVVAGEADRKFSAIARAMAAASPNVSLRIVPSCGHRIHLEQPRQLTQILTGQPV